VNASRVKSAVLVVVLLVCVSIVSGLGGFAIGKRDQLNQMCCLVPRGRNIVLSIEETLGLVSFPSQIGQDRWVFRNGVSRRHGYKRVYSWYQDDFYLPVESKLPVSEGIFR